MKRVILKPEPKSVVVANNTKEFKTYICCYNAQLYLLKRLEYPFLDDAYWEWICLTNPSKLYSPLFKTYFNKFYEAILFVLEYTTDLVVYEIEDIREAFPFTKFVEYERAKDNG